MSHVDLPTLCEEYTSETDAKEEDGSETAPSLSDKGTDSQDLDDSGTEDMDDFRTDQPVMKDAYFREFRLMVIDHIRVM